MPQPDALHTILLADDNPVNTLIARTYLEKHGHKVIAAENGRAALAALEAQDIDLVLLDCRMPIIDGYEVARQLREREAVAGDGGRLPIIAVTGDVTEKNEKECMDAGMDALLCKPFDPEDLFGMVERWLPGGHSTATVDAVAMDQGALDLIRELDGTGEVLERLIGLFLEDAVQDLTTMRHGGVDAAKKAAHNIKSGAANMGALRLAALCQDLETLLDGGDDAARNAAVDGIDAAFEEAKHLLACELPAASAVAS